jgi:uncharacterized protein (DUF1499 family)
MDVGPALGLTLIAVIFGVIAFLAGVIATYMMRNNKKRRYFRAAIVAVVIGILFTANFLAWFEKARAVPAIHDISTDVADPPVFKDLLPLRDRAINPPEYDGPDVARQQIEAYPAVQSLYSSVSCDGVMAAAEKIAEDMGWQVISVDTTDAAECRLEAVATTGWFGFKDDVVLRARDNGFESTIDIRSKSRVGVSDLGTNAHRILDFSERLTAKLDE